MTPKAFFELVADMRKAQSAYFRTRSYIDLSHAKSLEKRVDDEIERVRRIINEPEIPFPDEAQT